jgi:hypothetical protein
MKKGDCPILIAVALAGAFLQDTTPAADHHRRGVEHHERRSLDEASREYARTLELDPPRDPGPAELERVRRFAPRVYVTPTEFFPLKDVAAIVHPSRPLIAYHFFWEDDIDFPEDNDPCDHELMWVEHSPDGTAISKIWTYFHGRILEGGTAALDEARRHRMRPRVNVQWGKHGSMPTGWETLSITATEGDVERKYLSLNRPLTLKAYNEATFKKLSTEGRRLMSHPLGRRLGWPDRFVGNWEAFVDFTRPVETLEWLDRTKMIKISQWNSATIDQHFLPYNFRPKTEWPVVWQAPMPSGQRGRGAAPEPFASAGRVPEKVSRRPRQQDGIEASSCCLL